MVFSMTGFGRGKGSFEQGEIVVEIRSVNHRFFEFTSRTPRGMSFLDERIKKLVNERVARGKVDVGVTFNPVEGKQNVIVFHRELARQYVNALKSAGKEMGLKNDLKASALLSFPDLFTQEKQEMNEESLWEAVETATNEALNQFLAMRQVEGDKMAADLLVRLENIEKMSYEVEKLSAESVNTYADRLRARMREVLSDKEIDEARIVTEAAIFADRIATDEETVRLRSHVEQFRKILAEGGPVGRKLDFLVQELNREVNTIGSKCNELTITNMVVDEKSEIEKIREQVQNLE